MRILKFVHSCKTCDNYRDYDCTLTGARVIDSNRVASFCPLVDYRQISAQMASQERTITSLREQSTDCGLHGVLFKYLATILRTNLDQYGYLPIKLHNGTVISLTPHSISTITDHVSTIIFYDSLTRSQYKLVLSPGDDVCLYHAVTAEDNQEQTPAWRPLKLA